MKVLLINPPIRESAPPDIYPIGLAYIARALIDQGAEVSILDINAHRWSKSEVRERIQGISFEIAGIGTLITAYSYVRWLTRCIRELRPESRIWVGNSVATPIPDILLRDSVADVAVIGEGDQTVKELYSATIRGDPLDSIAGIAFKQNGSIRRTPIREPIPDIDSIPLPAFELFPQEIYLRATMGELGNRIAYIVTSRGCPYACTFCYHAFQGQKVRSHSPERVVAEIKAWQALYDIRAVAFADDLFTMDKKRVYAICNLLEQEGIKIKWHCAGRVNIVDEELLLRMKQVGCVSIGYGIESGSPTILRNIKKHTTVEQGLRAIESSRRVGVHAVGSFMIGNVGETSSTMRETVDFVRRADLEPPALFIATPYPGTELYDYAKARGKVPDEIALFESYGEQSERLLVNVTEMSDAELLALKRDAEGQMLREWQLRHPIQALLRPIVRRWATLKRYYRAYGIRPALWQWLFSRLQSKLHRG